MNSKKIVIASILKPVSDPRSYERFALSLAKTNKYDINIIGIQSKKNSNHPRVNFVSLGEYNRSLLYRIRKNLKALKLYRQLRPDLIIITSWEMLPFLFFYKLFKRTKTIYDIQENYALNYKYQVEFSSFTSRLYAVVSRAVETAFRFSIDHFFLAEKCYERELYFIKKNYTILENKLAFPTRIVKEKKAKNQFLFSGTISNYTGVFDALNFYKNIRTHFEDTSFLIIGHATSSEVLDQVKEETKNESDIILQVELGPIEHDEILRAITLTNYGIISYPVTLGNQNRVPTKLYEYGALELPYFIQVNSYWSKIGEEIGGSIPVDFRNPDIENMRKVAKWYSNESPDFNTELCNWRSEEGKLLEQIDTLMS